MPCTKESSASLVPNRKRKITNQVCRTIFAPYRARQYRIVRILHLGLWLVRKLYGTQLPARVEAGLKNDLPVQSLGASVLQWMFEKPVRTHYHSRAARYLFMLQTREKK